METEIAILEAKLAALPSFPYFEADQKSVLEIKLSAQYTLNMIQFALLELRNQDAVQSIGQFSALLRLQSRSLKIVSGITKALGQAAREQVKSRA